MDSDRRERTNSRDLLRRPRPVGDPRLGRGDDLPDRFPSRRKAVLFDMEVALTGQQAERTMMLAKISRRPLAVRYRVSRWWLTDEVALFWMLSVAESDDRFRYA
jgi:hypothetical protein